MDCGRAHLSQIERKGVALSRSATKEAPNLARQTVADQMLCRRKQGLNFRILLQLFSVFLNSPQLDFVSVRVKAFTKLKVKRNFFELINFFLMEGEEDSSNSIPW